MYLIRFKGISSKDLQKERGPGAGMSSLAAALVRRVADVMSHQQQHQRLIQGGVWLVGVSSAGRRGRFPFLMLQVSSVLQVALQSQSGESLPTSALGDGTLRV